MREKDDCIVEREVHEGERRAEEIEPRELREKPISEKLIWVQSVHNKNVFICDSCKKIRKGYIFS